MATLAARLTRSRRPTRSGESLIFTGCGSSTTHYAPRSPLAEDQVEIGQGQRGWKVERAKHAAGEGEGRQHQLARARAGSIAEEAPAIARFLGHVLEPRAPRGGQAGSQRGVAPARAVGDEFSIADSAKASGTSQLGVGIGERRGH